jgi:putative oxidoreductase
MKKKEHTKTDLGLLALRLTTGSLLAGHGAQKLFGWFGGHGMQGTAGWLESMGLRPGKPWALAAGASEFAGGVLMALGLLNPVGAAATVGAMSMATAKGHWGKPIWVTSGGAELPLTNTAIALAIAAAGPGKYSLDQALGIKLPRWLIIPGVVGALALGAFGVQTNPEQKNAEPETTEAEQEV